MQSVVEALSALRVGFGLGWGVVLFQSDLWITGAFMGARAAGGFSLINCDC